MKKLFTLLIAGLMFFSLTACVKEETCILLYENPGGDTEATVVFELDGEEKEITASVTEDYYISVSAGDAEIKLGNGYAYYIYKIYGIDIDTKDNEKELVIITDEVSSDVMLRVLRLEDNEFKLIDFENIEGDMGEHYIHDTLFIGYDAKMSFQGNTLETSKRGRYGMWSVKAEYYFDGEKFAAVSAHEREIVLSSYDGSVRMANEEGMNLVEKGYLKSEEELSKLKEGYVTARADFVNYGEVPHFDGVIELKTGDAFKIIKENSEGFVFIEKKSGESGWIYMGDYRDNRSEVSEIAFYMAD